MMQHSERVKQHSDDTYGANKTRYKTGIKQESKQGTNMQCNTEDNHTGEKLANPAK